MKIMLRIPKDTENIEKVQDLALRWKEQGWHHPKVNPSWGFHQGEGFFRFWNENSLQEVREEENSFLLLHEGRRISLYTMQASWLKTFGFPYLKEKPVIVYETSVPAMSWWHWRDWPAEIGWYRAPNYARWRPRE